MNKHLLLVLTVIAIVLVLQVVARAKPGEDEKREARKRLGEGALALDVRTAAEFSSGHLDGATNIPVQELEQRMGELGDKSRPIVVYCRSGNRSTTAKRMLEQAGFTNVVNGGGLDDVRRQE